ncbi:MAG TPA: hypothetical protein VD973_01440 [Symbiobacteriaceae bacterium]|jgi:hypothetical protein|nr:hypothetical protein [Symbiobacteriaceae bacterium]
MRAKLYVSLVPFLLFSALDAPVQFLQHEAAGAMALPPGLGSASELCQLTGVTELTLEGGSDYDQEFLLTAADCMPSLKRLTLKGPADLPTVPSAQVSSQWPLRLETAHAIFLGDAGMELAQLIRYATFLERTAIGELARDTGLRPQAAKPVLLLYGDEQHWRLVAGAGTFWGYYAAREQRIHMAHWKTPGAINTILLTHELFHWLAWEEGRVDLPIWLNEGLAHNLSWRIDLKAEGWVTPFALREWHRVAAEPDEPVPSLDTHREQDQFTVTAGSHLLQTRGREALAEFFALTRSGVPFEDAFLEAFGTTPAAFEAEYRNVVQQKRESE